MRRLCNTELQMGEKPIGKCPLCQLDKPLHESHFMPDALYPAKIKLEYTTLTSSGVGGSEAKKHLLCLECEERFNKNGESEVLRWIAPKSMKTFPLHDLMRRSSPRERARSYLRFSGKDIGVKADHFAYFALSLTWRAAVAEWPLPDAGFTVPIDLGEYQEPIRRFLMMETPLPQDTIILVRACTDEESRRAWYVPAPIQDHPLRGFGFHVRGVHFRVFLDHNIPDELRNDSCASPFKALFLMNRHNETVETLNRMTKGHTDATP